MFRLPIVSRFVFAIALWPGLASAQSTARVSVNTGGIEGDSISLECAISADGRFVAFRSYASNLVPLDTNGSDDIFVRDRMSGTTERVSVSSGGAEGNSQSDFPALSADGRFVAFESYASNLVTGDSNGSWDVFVHDRLSGTTECVSIATSGLQGDQSSGGPSLSADGRYVVFNSFATNLVTGDTNGLVDAFLRDRINGTTERVSVGSGGAQSNHDSTRACISADGHIVAFQSYAFNLGTPDTNIASDIYVRDVLNGTTERVSVNSAGGQANGDSYAPRVSADGRFVAFQSRATNLVSGDNNIWFDVFVHDRQTGATECVSVTAAGTPGILPSMSPSISADGRFVAFASRAFDLIPGDNNGDADIFLRDRLPGTTVRISHASTGAESHGDCDAPSIAALAGVVAFASLASDIVSGDTNSASDVFAIDLGPSWPTAFCFGDGSAGACPCSNNGLSGRGCENSVFAGGALLTPTGSASLANDTLLLTSSGQPSAILSVFIQGDVARAPLRFGNGLRCAGGSLKRLFVLNSAPGAVSAPPPGGPSLSARSAALGDAFGLGSARFYQTYYREPVLAFCPGPPGNDWNVSSGLTIVWEQ